MKQRVSRIMLGVMGAVLLAGASGGLASAESWSVTFTNVRGSWTEAWNNNAAGARTAAAPTGERRVLVQLGDSVAAGAGLPGTGSGPHDQTCARSPEAYVHRVAAATGMEAVNLACSGATVWNGVITDQERGGIEVPSQLGELRRGPDPEAALLTVGANDVRWSVFLYECARGECADEAHTDAFRSLLRATEVGVRSALTSLWAVGVERVYLTGYYDPFAGNTITAEQAGFSPQEVAWYQARLVELNAMLAEAAESRDYVTFVPVNFSGGGEQLVQGPNDPEPFHPTAAGQAVIAQSVVEAMR